jgi:hypothetical protein
MKNEKCEDLAAVRYWFGFAVPHGFNYGSICFFRQVLLKRKGYGFESLPMSLTCPTSAVKRHCTDDRRVRGRTGRINPACNIVRGSKHPRHALGKA